MLFEDFSFERFGSRLNNPIVRVGNEPIPGLALGCLSVSGGLPIVCSFLGFALLPRLDAVLPDSHGFHFINLIKTSRH